MSGEFWSVTWRVQGVRQVAELPSELEARMFAQICILLVDCTDVHVLPPTGPLDLSPEQVARSASRRTQPGDNPCLCS